MLCPGQAGLSHLTQFKKYLRLTQILHWIMYVLIMASGSDQSSELSMLNGGDDGSISPDSRHLEGLTIELEYFQLCIVLG